MNDKAKNTAAVSLGRLGGSSRSLKKIEAARANSAKARKVRSENNRKKALQLQQGSSESESSNVTKPEHD